MQKAHTQPKDLDKNGGKRVIETKSLKCDLDKQYGMIYAKAISLIILDKNAPYIGHLPAFRRGQVGSHFLTSHKRDEKSAGAFVMTPSSKLSLDGRARILWLGIDHVCS